MAVQRAEAFPLHTSDDVVRVRQIVRGWSVELGFSLIDQTKVVTAASELARNTLEHGGGGRVLIETVDRVPRRGVRLTFEDQGPGIPDIDQALKDGFTTGGGLGLGLGGAKRLMSELEIQSEIGQGTRIQATRWK